MFNLFRGSILSGILISLGCVVNLNVGGALGAFLFSFSFLAIVHYSLPLYTGNTGFCKYSQDFKVQPLVLLGNLLGCLFMAFCVRYSFPELIEKSELIIQLRLNTTIFKILVSSVMCGLIMTTIFNFSKQKKFIPLLVGVPLFILLDFYHSIIDAFYYSLALNLNGYLALIYFIIVVGNFLGCVLFNLIMKGSIFLKENQDEYLM